MAPDTAVLILNYNGERFLKGTLDSLVAQKRRVTIVVIDNNSKDGSRELIKSHYPMVELIKNKENFPFGKAYNRVMSRRKEKYVLILNNDITVEPDAIGKAEDLLKKNKDIAAVVFLEFQMDEPIKFPYDWDYIIKKRFGKDFGTLVHFKSRKDPPRRTIFFWGGASLIRTKVVKKVHFDEDFGWYFEDVDLGWSIHNKLGMECLISPDCIVHHMGGMSTKKRFSDKERDRQNHRNSMLSFAKNATTGEMFRGFPEMFYHLVLQKDRAQLIRQMRHKRKHERNKPDKAK